MTRSTASRVRGAGAGLLLLATTGAVASGGPLEPRTFDGRGNNLDHPEWGSAGAPLSRTIGAWYADLVEEPAGPTRPSARVISNIVCDQPSSRSNARGLTSYLWQWGQFLDHDIALVRQATPAEPFDIPVPPGDPHFDPKGTGEEIIPLDRSAWDPDSGTGEDNPRQQVDSITAFIDASNVYGSDKSRAAALRTLEGGRLATSDGDLLPFNVDGLENAGGPSPDLFLAGDIRANEQIALTAMHTLFVREHNRLAGVIAERFPESDDEDLYQMVRAVVGAQMQVITYEEFLPLLLGPGAIPPYGGYDPAVEPGIGNTFATAAFRVGHTMLPRMLFRLGPDGVEIEEGHVRLRDAFFAVERITEEGGIDPLLRGLAAQPAQEVDALVVDDVRNFMFGPPGDGGLDLAALNMQRGREHGLPSYNQARVEMGLPPAAEFADISTDPDVAAALAAAYADVDDVDLWVGGIAEDHVDGAMVGSTFRNLLVDQFTRVRDGDRMWYEAALPEELREFVDGVRLAGIIRANTEIEGEIQDDAFVLVPCPADVDGDRTIGLGDLLEVLTHWGDPGGPADVDGDGTVDFADLLLVLEGWGSCTSR